ncbi:MAG: hypothetical protein LBS52_06495 [Dysgonamonadaceae bacterium]|nr:hypothetical protein [Dysgonamonadaceae bacterium]
MKRKIALLLTGLFLCLTTVSIYAQRDGRRMNMADFEKRKMAYIQKEAGLSKEECDRYFPINNELSRKKFELHRQHRQKIQKMKEDNGNMSDEEYRALLENDRDVKLKEAELDKLYSKRLEQTLSLEKLYKAQQAEKKFMQQEVAKFREGRGERRKN